MIFIVVLDVCDCFVRCPSEVDTSSTTALPTETTAPSTEATTTGNPAEYPWLDGFLPSYQKPLHYDLWMYPDFYNDGNTFYGNETIHIEILNNTRYLIVHIKAMTITSTNVLHENGTPLEISRTFEYSENQYWVVETVNEIPSGSTVMLQLHFTGSLVNGIVGYYKSNYTNSKTGQKR